MSLHFVSKLAKQQLILLMTVQHPIKIKAYFVNFTFKNQHDCSSKVLLLLRFQFHWTQISAPGFSMDQFSSLNKSIEGNKKSS